MGIYKKKLLSITSSGEIGFWAHDIEASKMQGRARGRKGERKTYHINPYYHITMEFGGYSLNVAKKTTRARARKGEAQGVLSNKKQQEFSTFYVPGFMHLVVQGKKPENILYHYRIRSMGCQLVVVFGPFCSEKNQMYEL